MTWNYRIVLTEDAHGQSFGLYEVYYDAEGRPEARTTDPISFGGYDVDEGAVEVQKDLATALADALRRTFLVERDGKLMFQDELEPPKCQGDIDGAIKPGAVGQWP
jgi:hypothetical protein